MTGAAARLSVGTLRAMERRDALRLFGRLQPPAALSGEFAGHIPAYIEAEWRRFVDATGIGMWLGKGYCEEPYGKWTGHGYNLYRRLDRIARHLRFAWTFGPSVLDGGPALIMNYAAFDNWAGQQQLTDEIRQVRPGLLLGIYYTAAPVPGFTPRPAHGRTEPELFILSGHVAPWHGAERD